MVLQPCILTELTGHSSYIMITVRLRQSHLTTPVYGMIFMTDETGSRFGNLISHHNNHLIAITIPERLMFAVPVAWLLPLICTCPFCHIQVLMFILVLLSPVISDNIGNTHLYADVSISTGILAKKSSPATIGIFAFE